MRASFASTIFGFLWRAGVRWATHHFWAHGKGGCPTESLNDARPHLNPLPRGEDFHLARVLTREGLSLNPAGRFASDAATTSSSPWRRAGVRWASHHFGVPGEGTRGHPGWRLHFPSPPTLDCVKNSAA